MKDTISLSNFISSGNKAFGNSSSTEQFVQFPSMSSGIFCLYARSSTNKAFSLAFDTREDSADASLYVSLLRYKSIYSCVMWYYEAAWYCIYCYDGGVNTAHDNTNSYMYINTPSATITWNIQGYYITFWQK